MIHSLSGGVIAENGTYTFAKVEIDGAPYWFLSPFPVREGDRVLAPFGRGDLPREGIVRRVETASAQCAPVPMNRAKELYEVLPRA